MELSPQSLKRLFQASLRRGVVYKTVYDSPDTGISKEKFFVLVNHDPKTGDPLFFFITTSKLAYYREHPSLKDDVVILTPAEAGCFPLATAIVCRRVERFSKDFLEDRFINKTCRVAGELPEAVLWEVDQIVRKSGLLSDEEREEILGKE